MTYHRWIGNHSESCKARTAFEEYISFLSKLNDFSAGLALDSISAIDKLTVDELEKKCDEKIQAFEGSVNVLLSNSKKMYFHMLKDLRKIDELIVK